MLRESGKAGAKVPSHGSCHSLTNQLQRPLRLNGNAGSSVRTKHRNSRNGGNQLLCFPADVRIAADENGRYSVICCKISVVSEFAAIFSIQQKLLNIRLRGMGQRIPRGIRVCMITDHRAGIKACGNSRHHAIRRFLPAPHQNGIVRKKRRNDISCRAVSVSHHDFRIRSRSLAGCRSFSRHLLRKAFIITSAL